MAVTCISLASIKLVKQLHVHNAEVIHGPEDDELCGEGRQANKPAPTTIGKWNNHFGLFFHRFLLATSHFYEGFFFSSAGISLDLQLVQIFLCGFRFQRLDRAGLPSRVLK